MSSKELFVTKLHEFISKRAVFRHENLLYFFLRKVTRVNGRINAIIIVILLHIIFIFYNDLFDFCCCCCFRIMDGDFFSGLCIKFYRCEQTDQKTFLMLNFTFTLKLAVLRNLASIFLNLDLNPPFDFLLGSLTLLMPLKYFSSRAL